MKTFSACVCACVYAYIRARVYVCFVCVGACVHACMCVCMRVFLRMLETERGYNYSTILQVFIMSSYCIVIEMVRFYDRFQDMVKDFFISFSKPKSSDPCKMIFCIKLSNK